MHRLCVCMQRSDHPLVRKRTRMGKSILQCTSGVAPKSSDNIQSTPWVTHDYCATCENSRKHHYIMIFLIRNLASVITPDQPKYTIHHCVHWLRSFISYIIMTIIRTITVYTCKFYSDLIRSIASGLTQKHWPPLGVRTHIHATSFQVLGGFVFWRTHPRVASWSSCLVFSWHLLIQGSCSYDVEPQKTPIFHAGTNHIQEIIGNCGIKILRKTSDTTASVEPATWLQSRPMISTHQPGQTFIIRESPKFPNPKPPFWRTTSCERCAPPTSKIHVGCAYHLLPKWPSLVGES